MLIIKFIGNNELLIRDARVYVDDHSVVLVFNGRFWTYTRDVRDVVVPVVTVVAKGRKYICRNATLEEALAGYEKCSPVGV